MFENHFKKGEMMKEKNGVTVTSCSPKIWKKFTAQQQSAWECLFTVFNVVENFPPLPKNQKYDGQHIAVVAHNMACNAIWELARLEIIKGKRKR
jgi:hypothetical protein